MNNKPSSAKRRPPEDPTAKAWLMIFILLILIGLMMYVDSRRRSIVALPDQPIPGRFWGNPDAEMRITQFWDLQNPEGIRGEKLVEQYLKKYPDEIFFQTRYFPQDDKALLIALYAECASHQKKFRPFLKLLFIRQFQWLGLSEVTPILKAISSDAGIDIPELLVCVDSKETTATVSLDRIYGESLHVQSTPTYFLNGKMVEGIPAFEKALKQWERDLEENY